MINVTCKACKKTIRVQDACAGKSGRCPHCKNVLAIPRLGASTQGSGEAPAQRVAPAGNGAAPPPPPMGLEDTDDMVIEELDRDPSGETDELPSITERLSAEADRAVIPHVSAGNWVDQLPRQQLPMIVVIPAILAVLAIAILIIVTLLW